MSVIVELSIFPMDKGSSLSPYVSRAVRIVKESGLPYSKKGDGSIYFQHLTFPFSGAHTS